jgi:hypothetical protein
MPPNFVPRVPVLSKARLAGVAQPRTTPAVQPARNFQVLQSSRAPSQLCLFMRNGALDVK